MSFRNSPTKRCPLHPRNGSNISNFNSKMLPKMMSTLLMISFSRLIQWCGSCLIVYLRNSLFSPRELSTDTEHCGCGYSGGWLLFSRGIDGWSYPRFIDRVLWNCRWDPVWIVSSYYGIRAFVSLLYVFTFLGKTDVSDLVRSRISITEQNFIRNTTFQTCKSIQILRDLTIGRLMNCLRHQPTSYNELFHRLIKFFGRNISIRHFR